MSRDITKSVLDALARAHVDLGGKRLRTPWKCIPRGKRYVVTVDGDKIGEVWKTKRGWLARAEEWALVTPVESRFLAARWCWTQVLG